MKLERLTLTNYQRSADLDIELHGSVIHLFAGLNEAGKSTIKDAVRFAVLGTSDRVKLKKDYRRLVHRGGKKGIVQLQYDGQMLTRDVASGKSESNDGLPEEAQIAADLAFGGQQFVHLELVERLKFLYRLTGVRTDQEEIIARMKKREAADGLIERLRPFFRNSIEAAHKACVDELQRLRARWQQVAGEIYGVKKAEDWKPQPPQKLDDEEVDLELLNAQIETAEITIKEFEQQLGGKRQQLNERKRLTESEARLDTHVRNLPTLLQDQASFERDLNGGEYDGKTYVGAREDLKVTEELITAAEQAERVLTCPGCTAALKIGADGDLEYVDPDGVNFRKSAEELHEMRGKASALRARITGLEQQLTLITTKIGAAQNQVTLRTAIASQLALLAKPEEVTLVETNLAEAEKEIAVYRAQRARANEYQNEVKAAETNAKIAAEIHQSILQWTICQEALSPEGIQKDLLTDALTKINDRMLKDSRDVGWPAPKITPEMEIEREGGDVFGTLSESARWRVSVIVAEAISSMSGINMLVIDRMDVLDPQSRGPFLKWLVLISKEYDTILVMATMKEKPVGLPPEISVHWLDKGAIQ